MKRLDFMPRTATLLIAVSTSLGITDAKEERLRPSVPAVRLAQGEEVELDGQLDEPFWKNITPADSFRQQEPDEGAPAYQTTEVRIAFDRDHLYLGVMLYDTEPGQIIGYQKQRDGSLRSDDRFMFILDTFLNGRSAYFFETNPAGLLGDGLLRASSGRGLNKSWDGIWNVRVARDDRGWSAEIEIPFRTLNFNPRSDTWGIDFQRTVRRNQEESLWSGYRLNEGLFRPVNAGRLTGLQDISQGLGLEVKPYAAASYKEDIETGSGTPTDVGFDVNYSVTPGLRAAVTFNTDFAEVDVDDRQVNLTRFPLVFPEKRDFFLEGSSIFTFARSSRPEPYFSRRIGLSGGNPIPIVYGARLSGRSGRYDMAFLQVRTGESDELAAEDFTVARLKRNFFAQSSLGMIYTRRATQAAEAEPALEDRHTFGVDVDLATATFMGDKNLQFEAFAIVHTDPLAEPTTEHRDRSSWGLRVNYPNDLWRVHTSYREFGNAYDPAVGFVRRNGFRRLNPSFTFAPRPENISWVRQFEWQIFFEYLTDLDNVLLTRSTRLSLLDIRFESGDELSIDAQNRFEFLDEPFEIHPGVVLPVGEHAFNGVRFQVESASQRKVAAEVALTLGQFWSGDRTGVETEVTLRPTSGLLFSTEWERNNVTLPGGEFVTNLVQQRAEWQVSPWISLTSIVQYDDVSSELGLFTRFRWILQPGNDLFIVYSQNWQSLENRWLTLDRAATTKINYTHRF